MYRIISLLKKMEYLLYIVQDEIAPHEEGEIRIKVNDSEIENLKKVEIK